MAELSKLEALIARICRCSWTIMNCPSLNARSIPWSRSFHHDLLLLALRISTIILPLSFMCRTFDPTHFNLMNLSVL